MCIRDRGYDDAVQLLEQTLEEEKETDQKLTGLAEKINVEAIGGEDDSDEELKSRLGARGKAKVARA